MSKKGLYVLLWYVTLAQSRTIKTRILTNENGTKELVLEKDSDVPRREIDFLVKDLNHMNITVTVTTEATATSTEKENKTALNESILMKHWNALTEVGWNDAYFRRPIRKMYVNNTRILQFGPVAATDVPGTEEGATEEAPETTTTTSPRSNFGRRIWSGEEDEEDTTEGGDATEAPEEAGDQLQEQNKLLSAVQFVFQCVREPQGGLLHCLATRIRSLIYPLWRKFDDGVDYYLNIFEACKNNSTTDVAANTERTFYHRQRRFIYHVLFPLLVIVLIKYLIALPFLLFGVFAVKSLLLGLFSAGTATLHSIAKKYEFLYPRFPVKRYRHVQDVDVNPVAPTPDVFWPHAAWNVPDDGRGLGAYDRLSM